MLHALGKLGSAALLMTEFAVVVMVLLVLGATVVPGLICARKRQVGASGAD